MVDDIKVVKKNASESSFKTIASNTNSVFIEGCTCPKCHKKIIIGKDYYFCEGRKEESCDFVLKKETNKAKISENDIKKICNGKKTRELKMHSETKNKDYKARLRFDKEQNKVVLDFGAGNASVADVEIKCGLCQNGVGKVLKKVGQYGVYYKA